jgi:hypothetical protein
MTDAELKEIEIKCNREDISTLVAYIRKLHIALTQCKEMPR